MRHEIKAIFFDLDGTLLPLEQSYFIKQYLRHLAAYGATLGLDARQVIEGTLAGSEAMIHNDGKQTNRELFWDVYFKHTGEKREELEELFDKFYFDGFKSLRVFTDENPAAVKIVEAAHANGHKVVLATNPVFPMQAHRERMSWIGLSEQDFDYVTSYENSSYCKPNPDYYRDICEKIGVKPENCLMIGNDESDDMRGASAAGMECFLVTDHRIMSEHFMWQGERGSFEQALKMVERI